MKLRQITEEPAYLTDMPPGEEGRIAAHPRGRRCSRCQRQSNYWDVPDEKWNKLPTQYKDSHICKSCFKELTGQTV
jgi:hypothetical protein